MQNITLTRLVPHRGRMLLLDEIVAVDPDRAVTVATVTEHWPLVQDGRTSALLSIELVAQTASVYIGWREIQKDSEQQNGRGWLVGIKHASFAVHHIPVRKRLLTRAEVDFAFDHYTGIRGVVEADGSPVAEVRLQVMRSASDSVLHT